LDKVQVTYSYCAYE